MPTDEAFAEVFDRLKAIMAVYADRLVVDDEPGKLSLNSSRLGPNKKPLFFGAVQIKKNHVSYHLFPLYTNPDLWMTSTAGCGSGCKAKPVLTSPILTTRSSPSSPISHGRGSSVSKLMGWCDRPHPSTTKPRTEIRLMAEDQETPLDKADLLGRIDAAWTSLQEFVDGTDAKRLMEPVDAEGWSVKDHLSHIAAWERSMLFLLQGRPRHEGLGVSEQLYLDDDVDALNAAIYDQTKGRSLDETVADLRTTHEQLIGQIEARSDSDLQQPYSYFLPNEPGEESSEPIMLRLSGNTYEHYEEHRDWMEAIVAQGT